MSGDHNQYQKPDTKPEALRLAKLLEQTWITEKLANNVGVKAAEELRRLHEVNAELVEALKRISTTSYIRDAHSIAIESLDHLAHPEQEPVAWGIENTRPTEKQSLMMVMLDEPEPSHLVVPLYTAPPSSEWVGLTDEDLEFWAGELRQGELGKGVLRAVADHLKEKNK